MAADEESMQKFYQQKSYQKNLRKKIIIKNFASKVADVEEGKFLKL